MPISEQPKIAVYFQTNNLANKRKIENHRRLTAISRKVGMLTAMDAIYRKYLLSSRITKACRAYQQSRLISIQDINFGLAEQQEEKEGMPGGAPFRLIGSVCKPSRELLKLDFIQEVVFFKEHTLLVVNNCTYYVKSEQKSALLYFYA